MATSLRLTSVVAVSAASVCLLLTAYAQSGGASGEQTIRIETDEGTALNFDISSDGSFIVFDLLGQLWRLSAEGGRATPITNAVRDTTEDAFPSLSPDDEWMSYASDGPDGSALWIMSLTTTERRRIGTTQTRFGSSAWSHDGRHLAYSAGYRIEVYTVATGEVEPLAMGNRPRGRRLAPDWHPNGERVAFGGGRDAARRIWEADLVGGTTMPITPEGIEASAPRYAPSGSTIGFLFQDSTGATQVAIKDFATDDWRVVTDLEDVYSFRWTSSDQELLVTARGRLWRVPVNGGPVSQIPFTARVEFQRTGPAPPLTFPEPGSELEARGHSGLAISPDGQTVAVIALAKLWTIPIDGPPHIVTSVHRFARGITWSPDGRAIAWSGGSSGTEDLFVTTVANGETRRLTALPGRENRPSWSPDGSSIAFVHWEKPALDTPPWSRGPYARLRVVAATGDSISRADQTADLGEVHAFTHDWQYYGQELPTWSPNSDALLVTVDSSRWQWAPRIVTLDGASVPVTGLPEDATYLKWAADSSIIFVHGNRIYRGLLQRDAVVQIEPITEQAATCPSVSLDGSILYRSPDGFRVQRPDKSVANLHWPIVVQTAGPPEPMVLTNVRIFDATTGTLGSGSDIVIEGGRIAEVESSGTLRRTQGHRVIDANGRIVIPGLIDLHIHGWEPSRVVNDLYFGVTTLRDLGSPGARLAAVRDAIEANVIEGPRVVMGGAQFYPDESVWTNESEHGVNDLASIERALDLAAGLGVQHAKMYVPGPLLLATTFVSAARQRGMRITGHFAHYLPLVAAGMDGKEHHGGIEGGPRANRIWYDDLIQLFSKTGMGVTTTVEVRRSFRFHRMFDDPEIARAVPPGHRTVLLQMSPEVASRGDLSRPTSRHEAVRRLINTGVLIGAGNDGYVPSALHWELEGLVLAGLSPAQVLIAATSTAARILGAEASIGTIEAGKLADIVILDADPLEDIRNTRRIWMVIKGGRIIDRESMLGVERDALPAN